MFLELQILHLQELPFQILILLLRRCSKKVKNWREYLERSHRWGRCGRPEYSERSGRSGRPEHAQHWLRGGVSGPADGQKTWYYFWTQFFGIFLNFYFSGGQTFLETSTAERSTTTQNTSKRHWKRKKNPALCLRPRASNKFALLAVCWKGLLGLLILLFFFLSKYGGGTTTHHLTRTP